MLEEARIEVQIITVSPTNLSIFQEWVATLEGSVNAQIRAQVSVLNRVQLYRALGGGWTTNAADVAQ